MSRVSDSWPWYLKALLDTHPIGMPVRPVEFLPLEPTGPPTLLDMCVPLCPVPFWPPGEWVCPACRTKWRVS